MMRLPGLPAGGPGVTGSMCRSMRSALALAAGLAACAVRLVAAPTPTVDQLIAQGALSYTFYCAACHGGNGGGNAAARVPQLAGRSAAALVRQISALRQVTLTGPSEGTARHPRVLVQLNAGQIAAIAEYLASLVPPPAAAR
ncbi:MAG TPA: c-type cytochrome [Steroidobacteraceae bacterium]|nr:c-type cytochrome [Steroidobacteraceae bacterium]